VKGIAPGARTMTAPWAFDPLPGRWRGGGGYLAWIGRYDIHHKGLDLLIAAVALIPPARRPTIVLHGRDSTDGRAAVQRLVDRHGMGRWITVAGPIGGADKVAFLAACDGYLHPSRWESFGIAVVEALAMGIPSLVTRSCHIAGVLEEGAAASVVDPEPRPLAAGAAALSSRIDLSEGARHVVAEHFDWTRCAQRFTNEVDRLLGAPLAPSVTP
jgi:glycosyltransferase involved in cell wall biosynthesis